MYYIIVLIEFKDLLVMVFITGLTGLVGSGLATFLKQEPYYHNNKVVALVRTTSYLGYIKDVAIPEIGDSHNNDDLDRICNKYYFDTLIHISNKFQIPQFAELAVRHHIQKVIMISSTYGLKQDNVYNNEMMDKENYAVRLFEDNSIDYIFLRPTSVYGTRPDGVPDRNISVFTKYVRKLPLFPLFGGGKATVSPISGEDVGKALYKCLVNFDELKNKRLIIAGHKMTFKELIIKIGNENNKKVHFIYLPRWFGRFIFYSLYYLSFKKIDYREKIDRLIEDRAFETSKELL